MKKTLGYLNSTQAHFQDRGNPQSIAKGQNQRPTKVVANAKAPIKEEKFVAKRQI